MSASGQSTVDWEDAKRRIAQLGEALNRTDHYSAGRAQEILRLRAERLARVQAQPSARNEIEVMIVRLDAERYALDTRLIREVIRPTLVTPLPGTDAHVAGVLNLHGRPLVLIDGRKLLGLSAGDLTESSRVVVVGIEQAEFGLLTDATDEVASIDLDAVRDTPQSLSPTARPLIHGVTEDLVILLSSQRMMEDPRLWIDDKDE